MWILSLPLIGASALAAVAQTEPPRPLPPYAEDLRRAEEAMRRSLENMRQGVDLLLRALPRYDMPEVNENGDIIIRRRPPTEPAAPPPHRDGDAV
jgi:hypothetical protein